MKKNTPLLAIVLLIQFSMAQNTLKVKANQTIAPIQPTMYGIFFEDINFAADGGLYAELVKNRSFEFTLPKIGWSEPNTDRHSLNPNSGSSAITRYTGQPSNRNYLHVKVNRDSGYLLVNEGYRGMGVEYGKKYNFSVRSSNALGIKKLNIALVDPGDKSTLATAQIDLNPHSDWKSQKVSLTPSKTVEKAHLHLSFEGNGTVDLDMISLFPQDTWKNRPGGLRKDIVTLLEELNPGFLRFPGGCIVEGRTLENRYQWKKTIGPVADRTAMINRWNTEFSHRLTPDYYQSFGIGFYEYFLLSEDLGAEPLPILSCGMACQFNTGELVPMEELDSYIQDALDLIEFANGSPKTQWGKIRAEVGHQAPFDMKYIGIGNEQWGPDYFERYIAFEKAIKAKYPEIIVVSGSGPFPEGDYFDYGMKELRKINAEIVDEHYYRPPQWFFENAGRYDNYDRNGPKIFAGEYAAQSAATATPNNKNNWECALSEAAFMTGLERNADIVHLTSYAPLMAHTEAWQWTPDLIWFNNLKSYGTPNYYVQKLFANYPGTHLVAVELNGQKPIGQQGIYASAVTDQDKNQIVVKLVNKNPSEKKLNIDLEGVKVNKNAGGMILQHQDLNAENSIENPYAISPKEISLKLNLKNLQIVLPPQSFAVVVFDRK
jgi:alpha-N-arabinofuranosidase